MRRDVIALCLLGLVSFPSLSHGQLKSEDVSLIVETILQQVVADKAPSRVPAAKRGILFDFDRTLSSFEAAGVRRSDGMRDPAVSISMRPAVRAAMSDCSRTVSRRCGGLGWAIYSAVEFRGFRGDSVEARAEFMWEDRGRVPFVEGVAPTGSGFLVGFSTVVVLIKDAKGNWLIVREGPSAVR